MLKGSGDAFSEDGGCSLSGEGSGHELLVLVLVLVPLVGLRRRRAC